jgi:hypothetical protein
VRLAIGCPAARSAVKTLTPSLKILQALAGRALPFVSDIVRDPGERIDRGDVRPHATRQQPRCDRKILVVLARQSFTVDVRRFTVHGSMVHDSGSGSGSG